MRQFIAILLLLKVLVLEGREPAVTLDKENFLKTVFLPSSSETEALTRQSKEIPSLFKSYISSAQDKVYRNECNLFVSRYTGRTRPLLRAMSMKLSYRYVVVSIPVNKENESNCSFFQKSSPFVSVLLNRTSIYSDLYRFHGVDNRQPSSLHDLGVSVGAGIRLPITSKCQLDFCVRDELGLLNLDGYILGNYSFSQNNSLGVILGFKYTI